MHWFDSSFWLKYYSSLVLSVNHVVSLTGTHQLQLVDTTSSRVISTHCGVAVFPYMVGVKMYCGYSRWAHVHRSDTATGTNRILSENVPCLGFHPSIPTYYNFLWYVNFLQYYLTLVTIETRVKCSLVSLEPRLSILDLVLQLWRKSLKTKSRTKPGEAFHDKN